MAAEFYFTPELHLKDGRIIRDIEDAVNFAREQEARPGVDQRDEILHKMERAESEEEAHAAAHSFLRWGGARLPRIGTSAAAAMDTGDRRRSRSSRSLLAQLCTE